MDKAVLLILENMPAILATGQAGILWIASVRQAAQQTKEWSPEAEAAFTDGLLKMSLQPQWKPDAVPAPAMPNPAAPGPVN